MLLLDDEQKPQVVRSRRPELVVCSSPWPRRPDALVRFDLLPEVIGSGTGLRWTLLVVDPPPDRSLLGYMRKQINQLINANLRYTFGQ